tara:strand:+ start:370 stop:744 length:375 start_codon:yes stop_codon:yes gene_type:complete
MSIYQDWINAKAGEAAAIKQRREIEDKLVKQFAIPENLDGTKKIDADAYKIKIEGRINRRVNADKLQELAAEHGLTDHLSSLFRWKPEIAMTAWKAADASITTPLLDAITATPGRPSFTITVKD